MRSWYIVVEPHLLAPMTNTRGASRPLMHIKRSALAAGHSYARALNPCVCDNTTKMISIGWLNAAPDKWAYKLDFSCLSVVVMAVVMPARLVESSLRNADRPRKQHT